MNLQLYIEPKLLVLVPVMYIIGIGLKKSRVANKYIPLLLGVISVVLAALWVFAANDLKSDREILFAFFTAVTQGILAAGASVYVSQLYIQSGKDK